MDKKTLVKLIKIVGGKNMVLPVLDHALLKDGKLTISDLETVVTVDTGFKATGLVDWAALCDALESIDDAQVSQVNKGKLQIANKKSLEIISLALDPKIGEFPMGYKDSKMKLSGTIKEDVLPLIIRAGTFAGDDDLRPALSCVHIKDYVCGTDAHRLYWKKLDKPLKHGVLLNKKTAKLLKLLGGDYKVKVDQDYYSLSHNGVEICGRTVGMKYPDFLAVTDKKTETTLTVDKKVLTEVLKKSMKFANKTTNLIRFSMNDKVFIKAEDMDLDLSYSKMIEAEKKGKDQEVGLNAKLLLQTIGEVDGNEVVMEFQSPTRAVHINKDTIVMPVMLNNIN